MNKNALKLLVFNFKSDTVLLQWHRESMYTMKGKKQREHTCIYAPAVTEITCLRRLYAWYRTLRRFIERPFIEALDAVSSNFTSPNFEALECVLDYLLSLF